MFLPVGRSISLLVAALLPPLSYGAGMGAAVGDLATTPKGVAVQVAVLSNDVGFVDPVTVVATLPANGSAVISGSPGPAGPVRATYTPQAGFSGMDSFTYTVTDGTGSNSTATVTVTVLADGDGDGVLDHQDNCTTLANPNQADSNADGFGNRCDGDLNNNSATNAQDYVLFRQQLGQPSVAPTYNAADINSNGAVNAQDYVLFRGLLGAPPGPSALRVSSGYVVGGIVSGLSGPGLKLQNNGTNDLSVSANGPFAFTTGVATGSPYSVTVLTQPSTPSQTCTVTPGTGSGTVGTGSVTSVMVTCTINAVPLSLNVSGRIQSSDPLILQSNASTATQSVTVSGSGTISFPTALVSGSTYAITITGQPKNFDQTCVIPGGGGTGTLGPPVTITVSCTTNGKFYYAVNTFSNTISVYSLNSTTGALSPVGSPIPTSPAPTWVEADGTGRFAYVTSKGNPANPGLVSFYTINTDSGALTLGTTIPTGRDPRHITLDRTNTYAWVPNFGDNTISTYRLSSTGTPTIASAPVTTGVGPKDVDILTAENAAGTLVNAYAYVTVNGGDIWTYTISPEGTLNAVTNGIIYSGTGTPPILVIP